MVRCAFMMRYKKSIEATGIINYVFDGDLIHVKRKNISVEKLMVWSDIIQNMIKLVKTL